MQMEEIIFGGKDTLLHRLQRFTKINFDKDLELGC